jgi:beta-galactosidase
MEYGENLHASYYKQIMDRNWVAGATLWNLVDFGSEGRKESQAHINNKGLLTMNRKPKDVYYFYKAALNNKPMAYIASRDWQYRKIRTDNPKTGKQTLRIFTNLPAVDVLNNGKLLGTYKPENFTITLAFPFEPGENKVSVKGLLGTELLEDELVIMASLEPLNLKTDLYPFQEIAINVGCNVQYLDPYTHLVWEADREYSPGSFGHVGGNTLKTKQKRIATTEDILSTDADPLFQTRLDSLQAYRFDVPDGAYELTLLFAETDPNKKAVIYDIGANKNEEKKAPERVFSVLVNNEPFLQHLNLASQHGYNQAVFKQCNVTAKNGSGIVVGFIPEKDNPILNGIKLRKK